jgi:hypothetical protein
MKNIKQRDIIVLVIATIIIGVAIYFMWVLLNPKPKDQNLLQTSTATGLTGQIDQTTFKRIDALSDYGRPNLDNIGKPDLFAK